MKSILLVRVLIAVALIIVIITEYNMNRQSEQIKSLSMALLARDSVAYSREIENWWGLIESRVEMMAEIWKSSPA